MEYKCIKDFRVCKCDEDYTPTEKNGVIKAGSRWQKSIDNYGINEVHLEKVTIRDGNLTGHWVELSNEDLKKYFKEI